MLIPINWLSASYIAEFSPSLLMDSPISLEVTAFSTCWSLISANAGYLRDYYLKWPIFKVCKLCDAYFSSLHSKRGERSNNKKTPLCLFKPRFCHLTSMLSRMQRTHIFYLIDWHWKSVLFYIYCMNYSTSLIWYPSYFERVKLKCVKYDLCCMMVVFDVPVSDTVC